MQRKVDNIKLSFRWVFGTKKIIIKSFCLLRILQPKRIISFLQSKSILKSFFLIVTVTKWIPNAWNPNIWLLRLCLVFKWSYQVNRRTILDFKYFWFNKRLCYIIFERQAEKTGSKEGTLMLTYVGFRYDPA